MSYSSRDGAAKFYSNTNSAKITLDNNTMPLNNRCRCIKNYLPITPNCCGERGAASPVPEPIDPDATDILSLNPRGLLRPPLLATDPMPKIYYFT